MDDLDVPDLVDKDDIWPLALAIDQAVIGWIPGDFDIANLINARKEEDLRRSEDGRDVVVIGMRVADGDESAAVRRGKSVQPGGVARIRIGNHPQITRRRYLDGRVSNILEYDRIGGGRIGAGNRLMGSDEREDENDDNERAEFAEPAKCRLG